MLSLSFKDKILHSWIYKPITNEFFRATMQEGSFVNNKRIFNNKETLIHKSVGSISSKYWENDYEEK